VVRKGAARFRNRILVLSFSFITYCPNSTPWKCRHAGLIAGMAKQGGGSLAAPLLDRLVSVVV